MTCTYPVDIEVSPQSAPLPGQAGGPHRARSGGRSPHILSRQREQHWLRRKEQDQTQFCGPTGSVFYFGVELGLHAIKLALELVLGDELWDQLSVHM